MSGVTEIKVIFEAAEMSPLNITIVCATVLVSL